MPDALTITRTFPAPVERVWEAWTTPELFATWFGTEAVQVPLETVLLDVRPGGAWAAEMRLRDGNSIHWSGEYTEVHPPRRLALTMNDDPTAPTDPSPVVVELRQAAEGTEMTLTQPRGDFTDEQLEQTRAGYGGFFDAMEQLLTERP